MRRRIWGVLVVCITTERISGRPPTLVCVPIFQPICRSQVFLDVEGDLGIHGKAGAPLERVGVPSLGEQAAGRLELGPGCAQGGFEEHGEMVDDTARVNGSEGGGRNAVRPRARGRGRRDRFHGGRVG